MATLFTVGHGTRSTDDLLALLREADVRLLIDVRRHPGSRRHPHLARAALERDLPAAGVDYAWRGDVLGGRRAAPGRPTRHPGWRVASFRHYADWMDGPEFRAAFERLEADAATTPLAVMCAETLWWRCHRRLIADALVARGHRVVHLLGPGKAQEHRLTPAARVERGRPVYDRV